MASALLVTSGATVECSQMRDKKEVKLKGSGSSIKVGSVEALTVLDTTFKPKDFGICKKLTAEAVKKWEKASKKGKRPEVKCVPDLPLYMWEDADNSTVISSSPALHKLCTLKCSHKGTIKIVKTGQGSKNDELLEGIDPSILGGYLALAGLGVYSKKWSKSGLLSNNKHLKNVFGLKSTNNENVETDVDATDGDLGFKVRAGKKSKGDSKNGISVTVMELEGEAGITLGGKTKKKKGEDRTLSSGGGAEAKLGVSGAEAEAHGQSGDDRTNVHGAIRGSSYSAEAHANAGIGVFTDKKGNATPGMQAEAGVSAYAIEGEAKGGFTLFGIKIDVSGSAGVGGAAAAKVGVTTQKAEAKLKLGPFGLGISVDASGMFK